MIVKSKRYKREYKVIAGSLGVIIGSTVIVESAGVVRRGDREYSNCRECRGWL